MTTTGQCWCPYLGSPRMIFCSEHLESYLPLSPPWSPGATRVDLCRVSDYVRAIRTYSPAPVITIEPPLVLLVDVGLWKGGRRPVRRFALQQAGKIRQGGAACVGAHCSRFGFRLQSFPRTGRHVSGCPSRSGRGVVSGKLVGVAEEGGWNILLRNFSVNLVRVLCLKVLGFLCREGGREREEGTRGSV